MKRIAVFPGSFDPITVGHVDIVERAMPLFDQIIVAIGHNSQKKYLFELEKRLSWLNEVFDDYEKVSVDSYEGLTIQFCEKVAAQFIVRGVRNTTDFGFERTIAQLNSAVSKNTIETVFFMATPEHSHISSTIVREIIMNNGDYSPFVPEVILAG